jgi:uncharacterized membrane protein YfcA
LQKLIRESRHDDGRNSIVGWSYCSGRPFQDIKFVVPVFLLFDFIAGVILTVQNRRLIAWRSALLLFSGLAIGTAVGWAPFSGFVGGCTGGMFGLNGPPLVLYLTHRLKDKQIFRATLYGIFFVDACYRLILYSANQLITTEVIKFALCVTPFLLIGLFLGSKLHAKINENVFRRVIASILIATGVLLVI